MAPSKTSTRVAARKVKDRWRAKNWYRVMAPDMFEGVQIGETLADNPDKLKGRILDVTLQQLTGDFSKMHIKLLFRINSIKGSDAYSDFIGHSLTSDYIRRLTRRKRSKMDGVYDILTKDGFIVRVKPMAVTEKRIQTSQQHAIRMTMRNVIETHAKEKLVSEFIRSMISGELPSIIFKECKPIYPIKRIEIRRSEILKMPEHGAVMEIPKDDSKTESEAEATGPIAEEGVDKPSEVTVESAESTSKEGETPKTDKSQSVSTEKKGSKAKAKTKSPAKKKNIKKTTKKTATKPKKTTKKEK